MSPARIALAAAGVALAAVAAFILVPADWGHAPVVHGQPPTVFLHRGGSARWPQNTLTALQGAVSIGAAGVEFDLGLTRDGVPVVVHDPWIDPERCTHADGRRLSERVLVSQTDYAALRAGFVCGGLPDPDFPAVRPVASPIARLDDALAVLAEAPKTAVYLDVKVPPGQPAGPYAEAIFGRLRRDPPPNRLYVEAPSAEAAAAFGAAAGDLPYTLILSAPAFPSGRNWTLMGLGERIVTRAFPDRWVDRVAEAGAGGLVTHTAVLNWRTALSARRRGQEVVLFGHQSAEDVQRFCRWPVTGLIVTDPDFGRCAAAEGGAPPVL